MAKKKTKLDKADVPPLPVSPEDLMVVSCASCQWTWCVLILPCPIGDTFKNRMAANCACARCGDSDPMMAGLADRDRVFRGLEAAGLTGPRPTSKSKPQGVSRHDHSSTRAADGPSTAGAAGTPSTGAKPSP